MVVSAAMSAALMVLAGDAWAKNTTQSAQTAQSAQEASAQPAAQSSPAVQPKQSPQSTPTAEPAQGVPSPRGAQTQQGVEISQSAQLAQAAEASQTAEAQQAAARPIVPLPNYQQLVAGLLVRTRFVTDAGPNRRIEVWDLLIGPGMRSDATQLAGGAVIEVRGGSGQIVMGDQSQELRPGATLAIPDRTSVQFVNGRNDLGLAIRATLVIGRSS
jgi:hypothetical protein